MTSERETFENCQATRTEFGSESGNDNAYGKHRRENRRRAECLGH